MRRRSPPPSLSSLVQTRVPRGDREVPPSPAYSAPYTPSVYSHHQSEYNYRPSGDSFGSGADMQISSQLSHAWKEMQGRHDNYQEEDTMEDTDNGAMERGGVVSNARSESQALFLDIDEDTVASRLSVMGPKMKVHSKAPWETGADEDRLFEDTDEDYTDDLSDVASVFGRNGGRKSRDRSRTVTSPSKATSELDSKGWMNFGRAPRARADSVLKDMISPPLNVVSSTSDYASSAASSPVHASFQYPPFPAAPASMTSNGLQSRQRTSSHPRSDSTTSSYTTASSYSSGKQSASSPRSDRFPQAHSTRPAPPSPSPQSIPSQGPPPITIRTESPSTTEGTPKTSEDHGFHPYANPENVASGSVAPLSIPVSGSKLEPISSGGGRSFAYSRTESTTTITSSSTATANLSTSSSTFTTPSFSYVAFPSSPSLARASAPVPTSPSHATAMSSTARKDNKRADSDLSGMQTHAYPGSPAYNLITLEQAQEKVRGRAKSGPGTSAAAELTPTTTPYRKVATQRSLGNVNEKAVSAATLPSVLRVDGDSPPLPALPTASPSPSSVPTAPTSVPMASTKTLKPKRSGFLKMFGVGEKDKERGRERLPEGFVHVGMARSISSLTDMEAAADKDATENGTISIGHPEIIPPTPAIPAQYRQERDHSIRNVNLATASNTSLGSSQSSVSQRGKIPSTPAAQLSSPSRPRADSASAATKGKTDITSKMSWGSITKKNGGRSATLELPTEHSTANEVEFKSLQVRPVSSLFSTGLPMELILESSPTMPVVLEDETNATEPSTAGKAMGGGQRRKPELGIGIPSTLVADGSAELYSPTTASSLSSSFSTGTGRSTVASAATTNGPTTPTSSRSMALSQQTTTAAVTPAGGASSFVSSSFGTSSYPSQQPLSPQVQLQLLQDRLVQQQKAFQFERWEYEAQIRDLKAELAELQSAPCEECGALLSTHRQTVIAPNVAQPSSIMDRPRARSGTAAGANHSINMAAT